MENYAIILAAGSGKRFGSNTPKCFIKLNKTPIYEFSLKTFCKIPSFKKVILVVPKQYKNTIKYDDKRVIVVAGGNTRNQSFEKGLKVIKNIDKNDKILIHDAARINVQIEDIVKILDSKLTFGTLCYLGNKNNSDLRFGKYNIQTPQFCQYHIYKEAIKNPQGKDLLTYLLLHPTKNNFIISSNQSQNFKITFKKDLKKAKSI